MGFVNLELLKWPEAVDLRESGEAIGLIATGALEAHGPHLPLIMDTQHAVVLSREIANRIREPVVVPPVIRLGLSDMFLAFPGTVSITADVMKGLFQAYLEAFERMGITRVAIVSCHSPNMEVAQEFAAEYTASHPDSRVMAWFDNDRFNDVMFTAADGAPPEGPQGEHAGRLETSISLAAFPEGTVAPFDDIVGFTDFEREGWLDELFANGMEALSPIAVLGEPRDATREAGARIVSALADECASWIAEAFGVSVVSAPQAG
jgi:creatinine amidohydrolase